MDQPCGHQRPRTTVDWQRIFEEVDRFAACEQCGKCSSACPLTETLAAGPVAFNIRRLLRHVELGLIDEIAATGMAWRCLTCGRCEAACDNGIPILDIVRALRPTSPGAPAARPPGVYPPCVEACPAGIDIPGYLRRIAAGEPQQALALINERVPFAGVLGRVCPRPCESSCLRGKVNQPVAICQLKRFAADSAGDESELAVSVAAETGRQVTVVGAGPAGLTAAYLLRRRGHRITVLEARGKPGGMMRYGIPRYRLPEDVLDREVGQILDIGGIELRTGVAIGTDVALAELLPSAGDNDALFLATGLQRSKRIAVDGDGLQGANWAVELLAEVAEGHGPDLTGQRVVVIGGGDVAMDVASTALRLGAAEVTAACLERPEQMPAHSEDVALALEEGVGLLCGWGPKQVLDDGQGKVRGIELQRCAAVFDHQGRFAPTFADELQTLEADRVIFAVGQSADLAFADGVSALDVAGELVVADRETGATTVDGLFAGGEIATGPGALIEAIASGRRIAAAIDRHLGGDGELTPSTARLADGAGWLGVKRDRAFADRQRSQAPTDAGDGRASDFAEVSAGLEANAAAAEAGRCLLCDLERQLFDD